MIMVSFCWKMNFPHNETKINSVLLMMFLKLTIKVPGGGYSDVVWTGVRG